MSCPHSKAEYRSYHNPRKVKMLFVPHLCFIKPRGNDVRCESFRTQNQDGVLKSERTTITEHFYYKTTRLFLSVLENITTNTE